MITKQLFLNNGRVSFKPVDEPEIQEHRLLVRVLYSFISSGTEGATVAASGQSMVGQYSTNVSGNTNKIMGALKEHGVAGTVALVKEKLNKHMALGYSCAGIIVGVGDGISHFRVGDYVACGGASFAHHADMVSVPMHLAVKLADDTYLKEASITTIGAIALQGLRRASVTLGETVCVFGLGLIGQLTVQLAHLSGCFVIGIDLDVTRLDLAKKYGADVCLQGGVHDVIKEIATLTAHRGVDATIITASSKSGSIVQQSMEMTRRKGRVVLVGDVPLQFDRDPFYTKEIDFLISCSYGPGRYDGDYELKGVDYPYAYVRWTENRNMAHIAQLIEQKKLHISPLISQEYACQDVASAYESIMQKSCLGAVLSYGDNTQAASVSRQIIRTDFKKDVASVAFIGAGGFAKTKLIPLVASLSHAKIHALVDSDAAQALTLGAVYKTPVIKNNYHDVLSDSDINTVIIATPHGLHAEQTLDCLHTGKAVFVEKPAATTFESLDVLETFLGEHPESLYCVDFNRTYAPFIQEVKKCIISRTNPLVISYRVNAGYLPLSHWIQSLEHGGRIIGEGCHFLDLFCFLTDAEPVRVTVSPLSPKTDDIGITDNLFVSVSMSDGSICNLLYTSQGNARASKEYIEIFWDGKTVIIDDFLSMTVHGIPGLKTQKVSVADKGHKALIGHFLDCVIGKQQVLPIPVKRIIMSTRLTLVVNQLALAGGGEYTFFNMGN
jgi:predicted dehydrogenase/threonine dehydrogenase-like Zn-dependent dehydrogenase